MTHHPKPKPRASWFCIQHLLYLVILIRAESLLTIWSGQEMTLLLKNLNWSFLTISIRFFSSIKIFLIAERSLVAYIPKPNSKKTEILALFWHSDNIVPPPIRPRL